jgi:hypothetical protein
MNNVLNVHPSQDVGHLAYKIVVNETFGNDQFCVRCER